MVNISTAFSTALNGVLNGGALSGTLGGGIISKALGGTMSFGGALNNRSEDELLNSIWISLLGVEALMVVVVAVRGLVGAFVGGSSRRQQRLKQSRLLLLDTNTPSQFPSQSPSQSLYGREFVRS